MTWGGGGGEHVESEREEGRGGVEGGCDELVVVEWGVGRVGG